MGEELDIWIIWHGVIPSIILLKMEELSVISNSSPPHLTKGINLTIFHEWRNSEFL